MKMKYAFLLAAVIAAFAFCAVIAEVSADSDAVTYNAKTLYDSSTSSYYFDSGTSITINNVDDDPNQPSYIVRESNSFTLTSTTVIHIDEYDTESVVIGTKTITFYVNAPSTYTCYLYYDANGGSGAPSTQSYTGTYTSNHTFTISNTQPSWTGHTFLGWSTSSSASTASYQPGGTISVSYNGSQTLYAVWTVTNYTVTVSFNSTAASVTVGGSSISPNHSFTVSHGSSVTIAATMNTGYTFTDWLIYEPNSGNSDRVYTTSVTETIYADTDFTLENSVETYTVSFAAGTGGSVSSNSIANVPYGSSITVSSNSVTINGTTVTATASTGYTFSSWSNTTGLITGARTITANFAVSTYTVTVSFNSTAASVTVGGSSISPNHSFTVSHGSSVTIVATMNTGYTFTDWLAYEPDSGNSDRLYTTSITETIAADTDYTLEYTTNTYTVSFAAGTGGSVYPASIANVPYNSPVTVSNNTVTINGTTVTATASTGYAFDSWTNATDPVTEARTITANFLDNSHTVTVSFNSSAASVTVNGSAISPNHSFAVASGSSVTIAATMNTGYTFTDWLAYEPDSGNSDRLYTTSITETIAADTDYTLEYTYTPEGVYWSNGTDNEPMYNGLIKMVYQFAASSNKTHIMDIDLKSASVQNSVTTWSDSGYSLHIELSYSPLRVVSTLYHNGVAVAAPTTVSLGNWSTFEIQMDSQNGTITVIPVKVFNSFTDYSLYENQARKVFDFSNTIKDTSMTVIEHSESGNGANSPKFSVTSTSVFLDTYGVVLYNPTINLHDYFPQYDSIRVNFYSFALYGESITINNTTYVLDGSKVTVQYVTDGKNNYLPGVMPNATTQTKTMDLTNIYVTFDGTSGHVLLTFVNDRFTIDLGAYQSGDWTVSMAGIWYFTTMVYSPYTAYEKSLSDWKMLPETSSAQMLLIFLGILAVAGVAVAIHAKRNNGLGAVDVVIILAAAAVAYILLG